MSYSPKPEISGLGFFFLSPEFLSSDNRLAVDPPLDRSISRQPVEAVRIDKVLAMYLDDSDFDIEGIDDERMSGGDSFVCDHCGEEIQISLDYNEGSRQQFVQDCHVC